MSESFVHLKAGGSSEEPSPAGSNDDAQPASTPQPGEQAAADREPTGALLASCANDCESSDVPLSLIAKAIVSDELASGTAQTANREAALAHAGRTVPKIPPRPSREHIKILIVGERGVGKTTLWRNLLASYGGASVFAQGPKAATSLANFREAPEALATQVPISLLDTATLVYTIQEAPGYGDDLDVSSNIAAVADYLEACAKAQAAEQPSPLPDNSLRHLVDICLYLLPPRRLAASDAAFLRRLAPLVAVQPVLARADALPVAEAAAIREDAAEQLFRHPLTKRKGRGSPCVGTSDGAVDAPSSGAVDSSCGAQDTADSSENTATSRRTAAAADSCDWTVAANSEKPAAAGKAETGRGDAARADASAPFRFSDAALAAAGVRDAAFLPSVISGDVLSEEHTVPWPLRRCRFGQPLEALNPEHSDLLLLKRLVLEEGHHELRAAKAARFAAWMDAKRSADAAAAAAAASSAAATQAAAAAQQAAAAATSVSAEPASPFLTPSKWATVGFPPPAGTATGSRRAIYRPTRDDERSSAGPSARVFQSWLHHIMAMEEFADWSAEELRWQDYQANEGLRPKPSPSWAVPPACSGATNSDALFASAAGPATAAAANCAAATAAPHVQQQAAAPSFGATSATLAAQLSSLSLGTPVAASTTAVPAPSAFPPLFGVAPSPAATAAAESAATASTSAPTTATTAAFSLSLADSMSPPNSSRSGSSAARPSSAALNPATAQSAASPVASSPLNPAAPSFVFGGNGAPLGSGSAPGNAFGGQIHGSGGGVLQGGMHFQGGVTAFGPQAGHVNTAVGTPVVLPTQPFLQAAAARPYHFGASPQLGQFVFGGMPALTSFQQPSFAQPLFSGQPAVFGGQHAAPTPPASTPRTGVTPKPAFAGASGITFGTLAAAAAAASQPAAASPAATRTAATPATSTSAAAAISPAVSIGPSPLSSMSAPLPFGTPAGPFPLPSPTFGFGCGGNCGSGGGRGPSTCNTFSVGAGAAAVPAASAASAAAPAISAPSTAAGAAAGSSAPAASAAPSAAPTRPPIPRVPIAAVVSAAAAASSAPAVAADTPRGSIETPRASAAKKPKSGAPPKSAEPLQPPPGRLFSPPWTGSASFIAGPVASKSPALSASFGGTAASRSVAAAPTSAAAAVSTPFGTPGGNGTAGPTSLKLPSAPAVFGAASGNGTGTPSAALKTPPEASAASPPLTFGSAGSTGAHATRARTPSNAGGHHSHHSYSAGKAAAASTAAAAPAASDGAVASQPLRSGAPASPVASAAPFVSFGAGSNGGGGGAAGSGAKTPPQGGHGRGRGGGRHSRSR